MSFSLTSEIQKELISFAQELVRIKSYSSQEKDAIECARKKMIKLGYEEVVIDGMGNLIGKIGNGAKSVMFDAHLDTVEVNDTNNWAHPPFSGHVADGRLHGRGSVDMKSASAASIFAGAEAHRLGYTEGKTVYVSCTVNEEDCDGENLKHLFKEQNLRPDFMVICEPSNNRIALGHKGKAQMVIKTNGISAHGATPEKGLNAVYEMAEIIQRVKQTNDNLQSINGRKGSLVLSRISSVSASLNAVPTECEIYLDRRTVPGESLNLIEMEMERIIEDKDATWEIGTLNRKSWTGAEIIYEPFHEAWAIDADHELTKVCTKAFHQTFGNNPHDFEFWNFSTNAVTPVSMGIPTIGFGPGDHKMAHMRDESCPTQEIIDACHFYTALIHKI